MKGIVIAGPTGVGKTSLSIKLAKKLDAVIISADSMQVYKYLDIGTAKIKEEEMSGVMHYLIDVVEPNHKYSVGDYQKEVDKLLKQFEEEKKNVLLVGGTGLYIDSVVNGLAELPVGDPKIREELYKLSAEELHNRLAEVDPEAAQNIHPNNKIRVARALEVFIVSKEKFSSLVSKNYKNNNYSFYKIGLERERSHLYERINRRVDLMFQEGLLDEAKWVYENYKDGIEKIRAIGYKELFQYFDGEISLEEAKNIIKRDSRRYAKRQFTWFKRDEDIKWFNLDEITEDEIVLQVLNEIKQ